MGCLYVVDEEDVYDTDNVLIQMPKKESRNIIIFMASTYLGNKTTE
jgi:hypothetical protein